MSEVLKPEIVFPKEIKETPGILRIGVDLDGNVDEIDTWTCRLIKRGLGVKVDLRKGVINFWLDKLPEIQQIPGGPAFVNQIFEKSFIYETAKPIPGAVETLNKWKDQNHQIWFITARPKESLDQITFDWLDRNGLKWAKDKVFFREFWGEDRTQFKADKAAMLNLHVLIEDYADTVRMCHSSLMMVKLVLKYPWNVTEVIGPQAVRVNNWQEMDKIIQDTSRWHYFLHSK